jgi:hypothetical protein
LSQIIADTARGVGVFPTFAELETVVDELGKAAVERSVRTWHVREALRPGADFYCSAEQIADDPAAQLRARDSQSEGKAMTVALPFGVGGFEGAWAVAAVGGALAVTIAATWSAELLRQELA